MDGSAGALEYELEKRRAKYDLARPDGRVGYLKEAIDVLASSAVTATERDVYAGRLSEQTDVDKAAILTQLAAAVKAQGYRQRARKQKELLAEGNTGRVKVPYSQGGARALGVAFAQQQLLAAVLKKPEFCPRTLEEVGKEFNVTRERIRQIEAKALRKLRHPSRSKKLRDFLD